jgi:predicted ABC-type exoprotein transport system permease subunit
MPIKIFAAIVAVVLLLGFLTPLVVKLKDVALGVIILIGIVMMLFDLWQSLQREDD